MKDWKGNKKSVFATLGASSHSDSERQNEDFYATDPIAAEHLLKLERFSTFIWEPACGQGHLAEVFIKKNHLVKCTDLIDRGYGVGGIDFLAIDNVDVFDGDIVTNPPFKYAQQFVEKALSLVNKGSKVAMFLRIQFLETKDRKEFFKVFPPKTVYVSSSRILCAMNGKFEDFKKNGSAACYCWFVWEKGYQGETILKWFN